MATKKEDLRKKYDKLRTNFSEQKKKSYSSKIHKELFKMNEFRKAEVVMFFVSFKSEVNTLTMIEEALEMKKRVVVPLVVKEIKSLVAVEIYDPRKDLLPGVYGIFEPKNRKNIIKPKNIDLILVPGLVFDLSGHRIGYGGGYYDKWLKYLDIKKRIGLAFSFQVTKRIPYSKYDLKVNKIVTEKGIIKTF